MSISDQTRKLLWSRSGNSCAICKAALTEDPSGPDPAVVVGEECHIVSAKKGGPRFRDMEAGRTDDYDNLIVLCPTHHTLVDKQPGEYTEAKLQEVKQAHEASIRTAPTKRPHLVPLGRETWSHTVEERGGAGMRVWFMAVTCEIANEGDAVAEVHDSAARGSVAYSEIVIDPYIRAGDRAKVRVDVQCMNNVRNGEFFEITVPYRGRDGTEYEPLWFRGRFAPPGRWELETR